VLTPTFKGARVFHIKFGNGPFVAVDGNKLTVDFDRVGRKMVLIERIRLSVGGSRPAVAGMGFLMILSSGRLNRIELKTCSSNRLERILIYWVIRPEQPF
jgi:hypothetical protein